jgi:acyl-CoA thioesterase
MEQSFFRYDGEQFWPTDRARGPWGNDTLHGRVTAGLLARCLEREFGDEDYQFARLTVDLFRMATMQPVSIAVERVRQGRRIGVCHAVAMSEGKEIARATAVQLRRGEPPPGSVWRPEPWDVAPPEAIEPMKSDGTWTPMWETRPIAGSSFGGSGQKQMWIRETLALVEGESLTPFVRVAGAADIASPLSMSSDAGLGYVNADISLYLHRLPIGEWIGWEVSDHGSAEGVGHGECRVYDEQGPIGKSIVCAVANPRSIG